MKNFILRSLSSQFQRKSSSLTVNLWGTSAPFPYQTPLIPRFYASSSSNPSPEKTPHTPDTYQKDEAVGDPTSAKTHVVSGQPERGQRTERPFEGPSGTYSTSKESEPYELPADKPEEERSKSTYGSLNRGGATEKDVEGAGGPQDTGKGGRQ